MHNMEARKLEYEGAICDLPTWDHEAEVDQIPFRLGHNMVDETLAPSLSVQIADRLDTVPGLLGRLGTSKP